MRKTPRKCSAEDHDDHAGDACRTSPAFCRKNAPKAEAVKPRNRKTVDSPSTKNSAGSITRRRAARSAVHLAHR